jgi:hypothetical protein
VSDPSAATDAANKQYVDNAIQGLDPKPSVRVATTGNILLSAAPNCDSINPVPGDRVLVKDQTSTSENGIYVAAGGAWTRALDFNAMSEAASAYVWVENGLTQADTGWVCTNDGAGALGSTPITFVQFSGAGQIVAGAGLTKTGNTLDVGAGTGISVAADTVGIANGGVTDAQVAAANKDGVAATASMRTLGTGAQQAAAGNTGVIAGGTTGQVLTKKTATDYDTQWSTPSAGGSGPARVTSLPASPTDGQEVYYVADATNGILWHLRYNAGSASAYKWEFVGGSALRTQVDAKENTTVVSYGNLTTVGPDVTVPLVGDYDVSFGAAIISQGTTHLSSMGLTVNAAAVVAGDEASVNNQTNTVGATAMMTRRKTAIPASALLRMQYKTNSAGLVADFSFRWLQVIPIRVG